LCGEDAVIELKKEAAMKRLLQIQANRKKSASVFNKTKNKMLEFTIMTDSTIFHGEAEYIPSYSLGKKQVAGIKYERGYYYGKVIQSVEKSGRQRTSVELLTDKWIQENTEESFHKLLRKKHNMFIWVPVGDACPDLYPH
jgi:hypothetical protein